MTPVGSGHLCFTEKETEPQRAVVEPKFRSVSEVSPVWTHLSEKWLSGPRLKKRKLSEVRGKGLAEVPELCWARAWLPNPQPPGHSQSLLVMLRPSASENSLSRLQRECLWIDIGWDWHIHRTANGACGLPFPGMF